MNSCPLCGCIVNNTNNRLIKELCGHKKCRNCFIQERLGCKLCQQDNDNVISNDLPSFDKKKLLENGINIKKYHGQLKLKTEWTILSETSINDLEKNNNNSVNVVDKSKQNKRVVNKDVANFKINKAKRTCKLILPAHIITVETNQSTIYQCSICKSKFKFKYHYKYHEACNPNVTPYKCDICLKVYKTLPHLKYHMKSHENGLQIKCDICNKQFTHIGSLNRHIKTHATINSYQCKLCTASFKTKDSLNAHLSRHNNEKLFSCQKCKKSFNDKSNLRKHMISHDTNIKKYLCELCGKSYKYCWSLDAHNLTHSKSKSYKCSKCNKVFNNWNTLKRHQLSHTGKYYSCKYCDIKCRRKDNLDRHVRNTHPDDFKDHINNKFCTTKRNLPYDKPIKKQIVSEMNNLDKTKNVLENISISTNKLEETTKTSHQETNFRIPVINGPIKLSLKNMQHSVKQNMYKNFNKKLCEDHHLDICRKILRAPATVKTTESTLLCNSAGSSFNTLSNVHDSNKFSNNDSLDNEREKEYRHIEIYRKILNPSYMQKDKTEITYLPINTATNNDQNTSVSITRHNQECDNHVSTITLITGSKIMN